MTMPWLIAWFKASSALMFGFWWSCSYNQLASWSLCSRCTPLYSRHSCNHKAINNSSCLKKRRKAEYSPSGEVALHTMGVCELSLVFLSVCCACVTKLLILDKWQPFWTGPSTRHRLNINNVHVWANVFLPLPLELQAIFSLGEGGRDCGWRQGWNL